MINPDNTPYKGIEARTFKNSIIQLLEQEYKILGSHKVIELIADDIDQLHQKFYPETNASNPGEIQWVTTSDENNKPRLGQKLEEYKTTAVNLPYLTKEDIKLKQEGISSKEHDMLRIERLTKAAKTQGGLLTIEELAAILNRSTPTISKRIQEYQEEHKEVLPLKGYVLDIGSGTTHKGMIIELYEEKVPAPDIAKMTYHSLEAVDRYIKDYERIKFMLRRGLTKVEISQTIGRGMKVINQYFRLLEKYHPEYLQDITAGHNRTK